MKGVFQALLYVTLALLGYVGTAQNCVEQIRSDLEYLASEELAGRVPSTKGDSLAQAYIIARFQRIGYSISLQSVAISMDGDSVFGTNIIASRSAIDTPSIMIGAHYDHLGPFSTRSRDLVKGKSLLGADDNASGVSLLLMLAEAFINADQNIQFVALAGHEDGLFGSTELARSIDTSALKPQLMINLDMVGRLNPDNPTCLVYEKAGGIQFNSEIENASKKTGLNVLLVDDQNYNSDDLAFAKMGIPTLYFTSGVHDDHHRSSDTVDKINFNGICQMNGLIFSVIETVISAE